MGLESDSAKGEGSAAAHRAMKNRLVPLMHEQGVPQSKMRLHELKMTRERTRSIALELRRNAEAALGLTLMTSDVCELLTSFLRQLRKIEVELRRLNEDIEPLIDIDHLDEEFATNAEYDDDVTHVMIRIYYRLKTQNYDTTGHCKILEKLNSSKSFGEFFTATEECYDPRDLETSDEETVLTATSLPSDFVPQAELENATPSLAALDFQTEDALLSSVFQEFVDTTSSETVCSLNSLPPAQATCDGRIELETTNVLPAAHQGQDKTRKGKAMHDTEERDAAIFEKYPKRSAAELTRQPGVRKKVRGKHDLKKKETSDNCNRIASVQSPRKKQKSQGNFFRISKCAFEELTSEYKSVEDGLRIFTWLRRLRRYSQRGFIQKTAPAAVSPYDCLPDRIGTNLC